MVLVSNFYGNITAVLQDFGIDHFFPVIIESAVVGVRKPDPQIFRLGVEALQMRADEVVVIGDSHDKDIIPATAAGCQTIWLKNTGWSEYTGTETADLVISDFAELRKRLI
jgi:putative hydrolase of the HAD superfamily